MLQRVAFPHYYSHTVIMGASMKNCDLEGKDMFTAARTPLDIIKVNKFNSWAEIEKAGPKGFIMMHLKANHCTYGDMKTDGDNVGYNTVWEPAAIHAWKLVIWGGNRLAYPHRTGFRPVSDRCQTSVRPVSCRMRSPCHSVSSSIQSPCHHVMSDLRSHVGCTEVSCRMHCHFGCTALIEIHESNLKVVRCWYGKWSVDVWPVRFLLRSSKTKNVGRFSRRERGIRKR